MQINDLRPTEYVSYYTPYINKVGVQLLLDALIDGGEETFQFFKTVPKNKLDYRYEEGKWTVKDILLHLTDTERAFSFRAFNFARDNSNNLPGFDENLFADNAHATSRPYIDLLEEYIAVRKATVLLFKSFTEVELLKIGTANNTALSVRAAGFIICGHEKHHIEVIKERYL